MRNIWFCIPLSILYLLILLINNYYFHSSNFKESVNSLLISHFYMISVISLIFFTIGLISFLKKRQSIVAKKFFSLTSVFGIAILTSLLSSYDINIFKAIEVSSIFILSYLLISFFSNFPVSTKPKYVKIFN
ncbi:histidine kinase, partial [Bacillus mycoides]|nr:histidine kinase [Bacillus mycoides]